jgi:hypothetical protein
MLKLDFLRVTHKFDRISLGEKVDYKMVPSPSGSYENRMSRFRDTAKWIGVIFNTIGEKVLELQDMFGGFPWIQNIEWSPNSEKLLVPSTGQSGFDIYCFSDEDSTLHLFNFYHAFKENRKNRFYHFANPKWLPDNSAIIFTEIVEDNDRELERSMYYMSDDSYIARKFGTKFIDKFIWEPENNLIGEYWGWKSRGIIKMSFNVLP